MQGAVALLKRGHPFARAVAGQGGVDEAFWIGRQAGNAADQSKCCPAWSLEPGAWSLEPGFSRDM